MRWLPLDVAARVVIEMSRHNLRAVDGQRVSVFHMENDVEITWLEIVRGIEAAKASSGIRLVPVCEWLESARSHCSNSETSSVLIELIDRLVFRSPLPKLSTKQAKMVTGKLLDYRYQEDLLKRYVDYACSDDQLM